MSTVSPDLTPALVREPSNSNVRQASPFALAHHWMEYYRGGEAVLEQFGLLFPGSAISILVYNADHLSPNLKKHHFKTSFLQRSRFLRKHFRKLLPIFPEIVRSLKAPKTARFVLSSDASLIKGLRLPEGAIHVCYCHSPARYLWGLEEAYLASSSHKNRLGKLIFSVALPRLRAFDRKMAQRVDRFIANSICVQDRIRKCYNRESVVINPPVNIERFDATRPRADYFLIVSALVPYKRVDLAVDACSRLGQKLVVIGVGPEEADLRARAGACVTFMGWQPDSVVKDHYEQCRALLFPGIEDFGITPCEAQAAGAPVIAFGEGGALETVRDGVTGLFFQEQTVESMGDAIVRFENRADFSASACRENVEQYRPERFREAMARYLQGEFPGLFDDLDWPINETV